MQLQPALNQDKEKNMWYQNIWLKKTVVFVVLAILYTLLPPEAKGLVGSFAVGWMLVDITSKVFD